ncbi:MAG: hypothetical protein JWR24_4524 [Actinoallomurus sp.]|nr:hypothetical protein [Actinoallomurus sp.]
MVAALPATDLPALRAAGSGGIGPAAGRRAEVRDRHSPRRMHHGQILAAFYDYVGEGRYLAVVLRGSTRTAPTPPSAWPN